MTGRYSPLASSRVVAALTNNARQYPAIPPPAADAPLLLIAPLVMKLWAATRAGQPARLTGGSGRLNEHHLGGGVLLQSGRQCHPVTHTASLPHTGRWCALTAAHRAPTAHTPGGVSDPPTTGSQPAGQRCPADSDAAATCQPPDQLGRVGGHLVDGSIDFDRRPTFPQAGGGAMRRYCRFRCQENVSSRVGPPTKGNYKIQIKIVINCIKF